MSKDLFDTTKAKEEKLNPLFKIMTTRKESLPAKSMLNDVYQTYIDNDGNFLEQFQTTGFNPRFFELYLHAYLSRSEFTYLPTKDFPDFMVSKDDITVAIEATTTNPSKKDRTAKPIITDKYGSEQIQEEILHYADNTIPIIFGSPLFSKMGKKYWEKEPCKEKPLVFAIEAFHENVAFNIPYGSVAQYLYGTKTNLTISQGGTLSVTVEKVTEHKDGDKVIPSYFFGQPNTEHVSAILFTNNGFHGKFSRMGVLHGYSADEILIYREGQWIPPDSTDPDAAPFLYSQSAPNHVETWGEGIVIMHNPNALHPLPTDYFPNTFNISCNENGDLLYSNHSYYPLQSKNVTKYIGNDLKVLRNIIPSVPNFEILPIHKETFDSIRGVSIPSGTTHCEEVGHYIDSTTSFLGVILLDKIENLYCPILLARDKNFIFRKLEADTEFKTRDHAKIQLKEWFFEKLHHPQRIFHFE